MEQLPWIRRVEGAVSLCGGIHGIAELGGARKGERLRYRCFVEEGLVRDVENPFKAVRWQAVLGNESFAQKLRDRLKGQDRCVKLENSSVDWTTPPWRREFAEPD